MRSQQGCRCVISSRVTSISVGVLTALLWLPLSYIMANVYFEIGRSNDFWGAQQPYIMSTLLCSITFSAVSMLMVVGAVKRIEGYMFPWLAIHFVIIMIGIWMSVSVAVLIIYDMTRIQDLGPILGIEMSLLSILIFLWSVVYLHYKSLSARVQAQLTCANEGKILKVPNEPENPYHPVYSEQ